MVLTVIDRVPRSFARSRDICSIAPEIYINQDVKEKNKVLDCVATFRHCIDSILRNDLTGNCHGGRNKNNPSTG